ncbi:iron complex transport system permease protein [Rhodoblastus acidophilus]|uniref:Iron complex transport system permease protein n=1 Tax=Rhodoblastus acidophilus TaxID=1074 RepID=A0A212PZB9_RHOAC|nr:iron ABC transporter permease [Rhodoblastus acidophilus]PPQ36596.1 iron ABC transporter permease [Rhodoblastus acidophilus]RAI17098.1 iron ABC transporter permease [Rhodoblastus acidophilus]SNB52461.1 iron complex transport system permease protein [Rhodoblastus acidophilus]
MSATTGAPPATDRAGLGRALISPALAGLVAVLTLASLSVGAAKLPVSAVVDALFGAGSEAHRVIVQDIRLPRTLLAATIGAMHGLSGAALQGLLRNPLAAPSLFGAPQAAAFGAVLAIATGLGDALSFALPLSAILMAFLSACILVAIVGRESNLLLLILAGLALSSLAGAATALALNLASNPFAALEISFWLLGSLDDRSFRHVLLAWPFMACGAWLLWARRDAFRVLSLGEEAAQSLGVNVTALRLQVILGVALGVGASVAVSGTIGFIGLVAPHLMRPLVGHDPGRLLAPSALAGAALLLAADIAVRLIPSSSSIKVGVMTALIGVPFFLYLVFRERLRLGGATA